MQDGNTYKVINLVGTSNQGVTEAINSAVARASQTIKGLDWFQVDQIRGQIEGDKVSWFQVELKIGFRVLSPDELHKD